VLDVDRLTITYQDPAKLFADLTQTGARNSLAHRRRGLLGKRAFGAAVEKLKRDGRLAITLEIVYGHAFGGGQTRGEFRVDARQVPLRRAKNS
jgi:malonyl-CoA O-methyltransferase